MKLKNGVDVYGIKPELLLALMVADAVWDRHGFVLVVTSLNDGTHSETSLHYSGYGADLRTRYFKTIEKVETVAEELREALGNNPDFDVVVEKDHIHLEFQRKRKP